MCILQLTHEARDEFNFIKKYIEYCGKYKSPLLDKLLQIFLSIQPYKTFI